MVGSGIGLLVGLYMGLSEGEWESLGRGEGCVDGATGLGWLVGTTVGVRGSLLEG